MSLKKRKTILIFLMFLSILPYFLLTKIQTFEIFNEDVLKIYVSFVASFIGLIGATMLWWQFVLGIRPLSSKWLIDLVWVNKLHQNFGIYGTLFIFLHPLLMFYSYGFDYLYGFILPEAGNDFELRISFGKIAFATLLFIWLTSAVIRGKIKYRPWKFLHFFAYLIFPIVFLHAKDLGTFLTQDTLLKSYWAFLIITYIIFIVVRILFQLGYGKSTYTLKQINKLSYDTNEYIFSSDKKGIKPEPGQFIYLQTSAFGENHPFTVAKYNEEKNLLAIASKKIGKFSKGLEELEIGSKVLLDGAYGVFTKEAYASERRIVMIAGGIGITPFIQIINKAKRFKKKPFLFNCNKKPEDLVYKDLIRENLDLNFINIYSNCKPEETNDENCEVGFFKIDYIKKHVGDDLNENDYFVCGPPMMMKMVIKDLKASGVNKNQIFSEKFSI